MLYYLAPMEGITNYIYRRAYHHYFQPMDCYFTPFIMNRKLSSKEINDISPEHNRGMVLVPQIMANKAEDFIAIANELEQYGYQTVNLNLGCPSGTVVAKKRGAGFLSETEELDSFLEEIFERSPLKISIKTRIGKDAPEEWEKLLEIYNKYPLEELIVHPRIQKDFYKHPVRMEAYCYAEKESRVKLCYNGDIVTAKDSRTFAGSHPDTERMMIGRGVLMNPGLIGEIKGAVPATNEIIRQFHNEIYEQYRSILSGDRNTLYKMKEIWSYLGQSFSDAEKYMKKIRKSERLPEYEASVNALLEDREINSKK